MEEECGEDQEDEEKGGGSTVYVLGLGLYIGAACYPSSSILQNLDRKWPRVWAIQGGNKG